MATMEMDYNLKSLANLFKLFPCFFKKKKINIYSRSWVYIHILRLYLPLDVQKWCFSWVKLPTTTDSRTVKTKNLRNPRDRALLILIAFTAHIYSNVQIIKSYLGIEPFRLTIQMKEVTQRYWVVFFLCCQEIILFFHSPSNKIIWWHFAL